MATRYTIKGMAEEGKCEHCGANCPKRRVYVQPVNADGDRGEVQAWGVICASKARGERGTVTQGKYLAQFAKHCDRVRAIVAAGGGWHSISRGTVYNYPFDIRAGVVRVFEYSNRTNVADVEIPMAVVG